MASYTKHKSWIITHALLEVLKKEEAGIDGTITINSNDLKDCIISLKIKDFNFSFVKGLKKNLNFENYRIVYREKTVVKIQKIELNENNKTIK
ncbi:hypothetical protein EZS27_019651 [termite gut metagenome]|uniref:Uncharacterized protein n=1 Tax=termite gut metagenome TaxID=433724 RepID=A0A5J4RF15_9ZZZZ